MDDPPGHGPRTAWPATARSSAGGPPRRTPRAQPPPTRAPSARGRSPALEAADRMIGPGLSEISVDGCTTRALCGGDKAGRSPVDCGEQGLKRSVASDAYGVPGGSCPAGRTGRAHGCSRRLRTRYASSRRDARPGERQPRPQLRQCQLPCAACGRNVAPQATPARKGILAPIQADRRWVLERDPCLDERLRQAPPLHREQRPRRGLLPPPRRLPHTPCSFNVPATATAGHSVPPPDASSDSSCRPVLPRCSAGVRRSGRTAGERDPCS